MNTNEQAPAPVEGDEISRPASEQPVEAIGAGREEIEGVVTRLTKDLNTRKLYYEDDGFFVLKVREDDLRAILAAFDASPARPPMGDEPFAYGWFDAGGSKRVSASMPTVDQVDEGCTNPRPLYSAPTPMGGEVEALREALMAAQSFIADGGLAESEPGASIYRQITQALSTSAADDGWRSSREEVVKVLGRGFVAQRASIHGGGYYVVGLDGARSGPIFDEDEKATECLNGIRADAILALHPAAPTDEVGK